ncbi:MAG: DUF58 domain-containing protein [Solirubrobacteraceae bacterium]
MRSAAGCAALGIALLLVAGTFDAEPFYVTGAALVLLGIGVAAWIGLSAWGATMHRTLGARSVMEDEPLSVLLEARAGRFPLPPGYVDEPLLEEPAAVRAGRRAFRLRVSVTFARRGRRRLEPAMLVLRDPLGLVERVIASGESEEVLVLPRLYPVRTNAAGGEDTGAHARALLTSAAETEIDGLRQHVEGTPASRIHWPSLAKGGEMMERKLIAEADSRPLVVLDPRGAREPEDLDAAVRAAASLTVHFAKRTGCALLLPGDRRAATVESDMTAWPAAHVRLALMDADAGPALSAAQNRRGLILFVSARRADRPPRGLGRTPGGLVLVVPGELSGKRRPLLEVAGCQGYLGARTGSAAAMETVAS